MVLNHPEFRRVRRLKIPYEISLLEFQFLLKEISPIPRRNTSTSLTSSDIPRVLHPCTCHEQISVRYHSSLCVKQA